MRTLYTMRKSDREEWDKEQWDDNHTKQNREGWMFLISIVNILVLYFGSVYLYNVFF